MKAYELMVKDPVYCINEKIKFLYYIDVYIQFKLEVHLYVVCLQRLAMTFVFNFVH